MSSGVFVPETFATGVYVVYGGYIGEDGRETLITLKYDTANGHRRVKFGRSRYHGHWETHHNGTAMDISFDCRGRESYYWKLTSVVQTDEPDTWRGFDCYVRPVTIQWKQRWLLPAGESQWYLQWSSNPREAVDVWPRPPDAAAQVGPATQPSAAFTDSASQAQVREDAAPAGLAPPPSAPSPEAVAPADPAPPPSATPPDAVAQADQAPRSSAALTEAVAPADPAPPPAAQAHQAPRSSAALTEAVAPAVLAPPPSAPSPIKAAWQADQAVESAAPVGIEQAVESLESYEWPAEDSDNM